MTSPDQVQPELYPASVQSAESLSLSGGAIRILGQERIGAIEEQVSDIEQVRQFSYRPNPFRSVDESATIDTTILKPADYLKAVELDIADCKQSEVGSKLTLQKVQNFAGLKGLKYLTLLAKAPIAAERCIDKVHTLGQELDAAAPVTDSISQRAMHWDIDLAAAASQADHYQAIADRIPGKATRQVINNLLELSQIFLDVSRDTLVSTTSFLTKVKHLGRTQTQNIEDARQSQTNLQQTGELIHTIRKRGADDFDRLMLTGHAAAFVLAQRLTSTLLEVNDHLTEISRDKDIQSGDDLLAAESYVAQKAAYVQEIMRTIPSQISKNQPEVKTTLRALGDRALSKSHAQTQARQAEIAQAAERQARREAAQDFSSQLTEAKDIMAGGGRLKPAGKDGINPRMLADRLYGLEEANGSRTLTPEQCGLIVAVLTDRFERFVGTVERLQQAGPADEVVRTLTAERTLLVRHIKQYEIQAEMTRLHTMVSTAAMQEHLAEILPPADLSKLKINLDVWQQGQSADNARSAS